MKVSKYSTCKYLSWFVMGQSAVAKVVFTVAVQYVCSGNDQQLHWSSISPSEVAVFCLFYLTLYFDDYMRSLACLG